MKSAKVIRQLWNDFFVNKGHILIPSKSLIPENDPSLLWINSGVATLKNYFSGKAKPPAPRLVNCQKALRTNDIENVGITARHHTLFEMLGNFSIGDYFKNEAIEFAHEFVTQVLKLDQNRIYITYFEKDLLVRDKWLALGYKPEQLIAGSKDLNFWDVGSGPCGPNTEIFYDRGEQYHSDGPELIANDIENDRFIEIWNIVFSELNNNGDGTYTELAQKNIDTGAGLERIVAIMQDVPTNFDTDLFLPIIKEIEKQSRLKYDVNNYFKKDLIQEQINQHFKIIADHIRAIVVAINDGQDPTNTGRGYVIRRLIRRASYAGLQLKINKPFLEQLVAAVCNTLDLKGDRKRIKQIVKTEERGFITTLKQGQKILMQAIAKVNGTDFDVNVAFKLYETFGFPIEMTNEILIKQGLTLDFKKLQALKDAHVAKSKSKHNGTNFAKQINSLTLIKSLESKFIGYEHLRKENAKILYLLNQEKEISQTKAEQISYLVLDETPFYATSGGQLHDQGYLIQGDQKIELLDVFKDKHHNHVHVVKGKIDVTLPIKCYVDQDVRQALMRHHSATHLLFAALRNLYGDAIKQLGSDLNSKRLIFDFPLDHKIDAHTVAKIEDLVNQWIEQDQPCQITYLKLDQIKKDQIVMTIDEQKYSDQNRIRVVSFKNITSDCCGGTHVKSSAAIESFKIIRVENKGANVRRIYAIAGFDLTKQHQENLLGEMQNQYLQLVNKLQKIDPNQQLQPINFNSDLDLNRQLIIYQNEIAKLKHTIKLETKVHKNMEIVSNFQTIKMGKLQLLVGFDLENRLLKQAATQMRIKWPDAIIVAIAKPSDDHQSVLVITSQNYDVKVVMQLDWMQQIIIKGGGNHLIWQGIGNYQVLTGWFKKLTN